MSKFIHLHVHSHYSLLDGLAKIDQIIAKAKEYGMPAVALTDHGAMFGIIEFYEKCQKAGIKPILGLETYVAPRTMKDKAPKIDSTPYHLILLAKDYEGYQNLMKITSVAHLEGYYYKPRVDKEVLRKYSEGIIALSACLGGEVNYYASLGNLKQAEKSALEYEEIFGKGNFYLELQNHPQLDKQKICNANLLKLAEKLDMPLVATNDVHYINKEDAEAQDALLCVQTGKFLSDVNRMSMKEKGEFFDISFRSPDEMCRTFAHIPQACENTLKIAEQCNVEIELGKFHFPQFMVPEGHDYESYLRQLIEERLPKNVGEITPQMRERLEFELQVIKEKGYLGYFLIVQDFVHWAKERGIPTNTRGSAAGCFVSYALGITAAQLNPIEYNLPFERFLNPFRPSAPDIDIDIADSSRDELIQYVAEKYGQDQVAQICTFGTMASKAAIRDVARVLSYPYSFGDELSKLVPTSTQTHYIGIQKSIEMVPELRERYKNDPDAKRTLDLATKLEGCARHASVHAAGVVIAPDTITDYTPVMKDTKGDRMVTQYEMHTVGEDGVGLIKMDFLGLANLTIIQTVLKIVQKTRAIEIDLDKIPLDDKETFKLLASAETIGVFQLESEGMRRYIRELRPTTIHDIMAMVALYRPGPMNFIPEYVARKHNPKLIKYLDPRMEKILEKSLGLIVYQDDVLMIAIELAGYNWMEVDKFRKAIGKKIVSEMAAQKEKFFTQIIERGMKPEIAQELWEQIETFAGYGFNKSHAASYGLVAYQTAYLKAHYPSEFMAAWLTSEQSRDIDKVAFALQEAERMKIKVLPPDINESFVDFGVVKETGEIIYALAAIKNVGRQAAETIVEERKERGRYKNFEDFLYRIGPKVANKKILENLAKAGALDGLIERNSVLVNMEAILKFTSTLAKNNGTSQIDLFGASESTKPRLILIDVDPAERRQKLMWEKELLGIYLTDHPLGEISTILNGFVTPIQNITVESVGQTVRIAGIITQMKKILTRSNQNMGFVKVEDRSAILELVVFPKIFEDDNLLWRTDNIIVAEGRVDNKDGSLKIIVDWAKELGANKDEALEILRSLGEVKQTSRRYKKNGENTEVKEQKKVKKEVQTELEASLVITLPKGSGKNILENIKNIILSHTGDNSVVLRIPFNGGFKEVEAKTKVTLSSLLKRELAELVGKDNVTIAAS